MEETKTPTMKISDLITELEGLKKECGDVEVFLTNEKEECFDGLGRAFVIVAASTNEKVVALLRNKEIIKL